MTRTLRPCSQHLSGSASDVHIRLWGDHLFAVVNEASVSAYGIYDVTDPSNPILLVSEPLIAGAAGELVIRDDRAFITSAAGSLTVDLSNRSSPYLADIREDEAGFVPIARSGDYVVYSSSTSPEVVVTQISSHHYHTDRNTTVSTELVARERVELVRLTAVTNDPGDPLWSAHQNATFAPDPVVLPNGDRVTYGQDGLRWRAELRPASSMPNLNPTVESVRIDCRYRFPVIHTISDVPADEGGWARVHFKRSGHDFDAHSDSAEDYIVWSRVGSSGLEPLTGGSELPDRLRDSLPLSQQDGRYRYDPSAPSAAKVDLPPGTWEILTSFPAIGEDDYVARVPTLGDSTAAGAVYTVFAVSAHAVSGQSWASPPDSGFSADNIAPAPPLNFRADYGSGTGTDLAWDPAPEEDFQHYRVYRSVDPGFQPSPDELVHTTTQSTWTDPVEDGRQYEYRVTAVDDSGNESEAAEPTSVTAVGDDAVPTKFALHANSPNPFNGSLVRTLVDGPERAGHRSVKWRGRDDDGRAVASGVYLYRLTAPGLTKTRRMVLME